jgi:ATP-dependent Lon protease
VVGRCDEGGLLEADIVPAPETGPRLPSLDLLLREVKSAFLEYAATDHRIPEDALLSISSCDSPVEASHRMAAHLLVRLNARQELLEAPGPEDRLHLIARIVEAETEMIRLGRKIELRRNKTMGRGTREPVLDEPRRRERRRDLDAEGDEAERELADLAGAISKARMPSSVEEKARRELDRLGRMASLSPEATVVRTYLDWLLAVPWRKRTRDRTNLTEAAGILDHDHHGLAPVKERILEQIAVMRLSRGVRGPVLCLTGPPGVGKTSIGKSDRQMFIFLPGVTPDQVELGPTAAIVEIAGGTAVRTGKLSLEQARAALLPVLPDAVDATLYPVTD